MDFEMVDRRNEFNYRTLSTKGIEYNEVEEEKTKSQDSLQRTRIKVVKS
jgi:hypothetical protein